MQIISVHQNDHFSSSVHAKCSQNVKWNSSFLLMSEVKVVVIDKNVLIDIIFVHEISPQIDFLKKNWEKSVCCEIDWRKKLNWLRHTIHHNLKAIKIIQCMQVKRHTKCRRFWISTVITVIEQCVIKRGKQKSNKIENE